MIAGFTGTRQGMTHKQAHTVRNLLRISRVVEVHHGDCIGADEEFHYMCIEEDIPRIVIHPPIDSKFRAYCKTRPDHMDFILPKRGYLIRNRHIIDRGKGCLIATPFTDYEVRRGSGTWAAIRYAEKIERKILFVGPAGALDMNYLS